LTELLEGWNPEEHPELVEMVQHLASALMADDGRLVADAFTPAMAATAPSGSAEE
jgi:hypothetical protein